MTRDTNIDTCRNGNLTRVNFFENSKLFTKNLIKKLKKIKN